MSNMSEEMELNPSSSSRRKSKSKAKKLKSAKVLYILLIIICAFGLLYQTFDLIFQYYHQNVVVNIKYEDNVVETIPAITICHFNGLSLEKIAKRFGEYKKVYDKYLNLVKDLTLNELTSDNKTVRDIMAELVTGDAIMDVHGQLITELFNMSIAFEYNERMSELIQFKYPFWFEITGYHLDENSTYRNIAINMNNETFQLFTPIETLVLDESVLVNNDVNKCTKKCFTFFSHLNPLWRGHKLDFTQMSMVIHYDRHWNNVLELAKHGFEMAVHSADEFPEHKQFRNFHFGHSYDILFNRWSVDMSRVKDFNQVLCREYDINEDLAENRMRSECVRHCIHEKLMNCWIHRNPFYGQTEDVHSCIPLSLRIDRKMSETPMKLCGYVFECQVIEFERECQSLCPHSCVSHVYNFDVTSDKHEWPDTLKKPFPAAKITMRHNQLPDQVTEHIPAMSFIQFISGFGGLLGMWLGLSAVAIFNYAIKYFLPG